MDIGEIICGAVDTIVSKRLEGLQYDITKICTIVDDSKRSEGEYVVNDGSGKFRAYSNETHYRNGNSVLVKIPSGDYTLRKTIEGLYNQQTYQPFNYEPPLNKMTSVGSLNLSDIENDEFSILANGDVNVVEISPEEKGYDIANKEEPYTRLGVRANFKAPLNTLGAAIGDYGLCLRLVKKDKSEALLYLNTSDMYGDPYAFEGYFSQEKVFDLTPFGSFNELYLYLYQKSNFYDDKGNSLVSKEEEDGFPLPSNIFVKDIEIFLGYDENYIKREGLYLFTADSLEYDYNEDADDGERTVNLKWYIYDDEGDRINVLAPTEDKKDKIKFDYEVHWYRRHDVKDNLEVGWEEVEAQSIVTYTFTLGQDKQVEEVKVVGYVKNIQEDAEQEENNEEISSQDEENNEEIIKQVESKRYESNILTFTNKNLMPDSRAMAALKGLSLNLSDNSNGNYLIYNQNGKLLVDGADKQKRTVELFFNNASVEGNPNIKVTNVKWFFPKDNERAMISSEVISSDEYSMSVYGISLYGYKTNKYTHNYYIKDNFSQGKSQNYIIVQADVDGTPCEVIKELTFGRAGTSGNLETLVLDFVNNDVLDVSDGGTKTVTVKAQLYDAQGYPLSLDELGEEDHIRWDLINNFVDDDGNNLVGTSLNENQKINCSLKLSEKAKLLNSNYTVLQCDLEYQGKSYSAKIPIPIKNGVKYLYLEGAKEIIYDYNGVPSYYAGPYRLRYIEDDKEIYTNEASTDGYSWDLSIPKNSLQKEDLMPVQLGPQDRLITNPFYIEGAFERPICVNCIYKDEIVWSQPIVAWQNKYDIQLLNEWFGTGLKLDEDGGTIMSTMLGAGRKNEDDNTFSGVLIGDVRKGTEQDNVGQDDGEQLTGIYGISHGVQTYSLTEDGKATFGAKGSGQIIIDGKEGRIKSGNWDAQSEGMLIDLDDGKINISVPKKDKDNKVKNYFLIKDPKKNELIHIDNEKYYLQSSDGNTKLDLQEGTFISGDINGEHVLITSSDKYGNYLEAAVKRTILIGDKSEDTYPKVLEFGPNHNRIRTKNFLEQEYETVEINNKKLRLYYLPAGSSFNYSFEYPEQITKVEMGANTLYYFGNTKSKPDVAIRGTISAPPGSPLYFAIEEISKGTDDKDYTIYQLEKTTGEVNPKEIEFTNGKMPTGYEDDFDQYFLYEKMKAPISATDSGKKDEDGEVVYTTTSGTRNFITNVDGKPIPASEYKKYFIAMLIPMYKDIIVNKIKQEPTGIEIDLDSGIINGYNMYLRGISKEKGSFILDSSNLTSPFQLRDRANRTTFSIDWDGTLNCNKVKSLNNDGRSKYAISIGNNFYVTSSGSAGGGTWGGSSLGVAGFKEDTITSGKIILRK